MRMFFKILLFPITLVLSLIVNVSCFVVGAIGGLLSIVSFILFAGSLAMLIIAIFGITGVYFWQPAAIVMAIAFIISPYGLPKLAAWFVCKVDDLNDLIKAI
jgi:hypothetical protein